jgi:hypothetical protein
MGYRKHKTLGNVLYVLDRRGNVYINEHGKVKRSKTEYHYELMTNKTGRWQDSGSYTSSREATDKLKIIAGNNK